jgi:hypothetical protein
MNLSPIDSGHRLRRFPILAITIAACLITLVTVDARAAHSPSSAGGKVTVVNSARVYHPTVLTRGTVYKAPAILMTSTVFAAIPEWKEIKRKNLTDRDAEYHLLLKAANHKFNKAVATVQMAKSYDIIAETGAIKCEKITPAEITADVIKAIPTGKI